MLFSEFQGTFCEYFKGPIMICCDSMRTIVDFFEHNYDQGLKNAFPAPAYNSRSKSRACFVDFYSVFSKCTISVPAHSKTQKHVYLWQLLAFLVFLVLK